MWYITQTMQTRIFASVLAVALAGVSAVALAGPEQDFEAAVKAGKPLSAEAAYRELTRENRQVRPILHYQAAAVAEALGKASARNDRWTLYARLEKSWTKEVEFVHWRLCSSGVDVDMFTRLAGNVKPSQSLWDLGVDMFWRLWDQRRRNEILRLSGVMLGKFQEPRRHAWLTKNLCDRISDCGPDFPRKELHDLILRTPGLGMTDGFKELLFWGNQRDAFDDAFPLEYMARHKDEKVSDEVLDWSIRTLDEGNIDKLDPEKDKRKIALRDRIVKLSRELRDRILDGDTPKAAARYMLVSGCRLPGSYYPGWKKDAPAPGLADVVRKVSKAKSFDEADARIRNGFFNDLNWLIENKRFDERETAEFKALFAARAPRRPDWFDKLNKEMHETKDSNVRAAKAREMLTKAGKDFLWWDDVEWACNQLSRDKYADAAKLWQEFRRRQADLFGTHNWLSGIVPAKEKQAEQPYPNIDMRKMGARYANDYARRCWDNLKPGPARNKVVIDFYLSRPFEEHDPDGIYWAHEVMRRNLGVDPKAVATFPLDRIMDALYVAGKPVRWSWDVYLDPVRWGYALGGGKLDAAVKRYRAWADSLDPVKRYDAYVNLCRVEGYVRTGDGKAQWGRFLSAKQFMDFLPGLTEAVKGVPDVQAGYLNFQFADYWYWAWDNVREVKDEATKKAWGELRDAFYDAGVSRLLAGARNSEGFGNEEMLWARAAERAIAAKDVKTLARVARPLALSVGWRYGCDYYIKLMGRLRDGGHDEPLYLFSSNIPQGTWKELIAAAAKFRTEVSSRLPGVYPVDEKDPSYPLYVAADALARKNPERAWQILQVPRNQDVFAKEILKLPPDFAIWGVEQLRLARGEKDRLLLKARQIAASVLAQEGKVAPETAAAMILSTAEGYRDQQNFEAAKLEYQTLRENPAYHATKYGRRAMFRAVDLQIASGNLQGVEPTLEYWLSQNDREVQAQAHYFLAKIAFDRKDYDETIKQLRETFAISYTHTEGRFLHGQWKLATNSEVDDTDVPVGDLSERSLIRPGGQLTITVQDRNLSVAGGGASIPVVVTSEPSGDREVVGLYPTSRDPSVFKGVVDVRLGKACPSNRVVEVRGDDTVAYVIDPAFLKERGLPLNEPKRMNVIDDAKLAIGAGAPRTDEKKTEKGMDDLLAGSTDLSDSGVSDRLRPGNPLYVVVQDRDCSLGGDADTVRVRLETTSGDRIESFALKEEKPFSGVFRGRVETSLPPPRAFASDTAAGMNPGDVINSRKKEGWKSLSDGQPGKWFAVDTMDSVLFSAIEMETPSAPDVNVLRLVGTLGQKTVVLGRFPAEQEDALLRLRLQQSYDWEWSRQRSFGKLSGYYQNDRAPKSKAVEGGVRFRVIKDDDRRWQTARFSGAFAAPKGMDALRLRVVPASTDREAFHELFVAVAVDGDVVFSDYGKRLLNAVVSCDLAPGCHRLEVVVTGCCRNDGFDLMWEPADGEAKPIPADWFDEAKHPELRTFVKPVARIEKTKTGFKADFARPERLRSFRWEFVDVRSPEVAVTSISATDAAGKAVLPVESEFSSALLNDTLEVAPGDRITVSYEDERTTSGEKKVIQRQMSSSFNNARVRFVFEGVEEHGYLRAYDAFRFQPGDTLVLCVEDPDCDVTDGADKVEVEVRNAKGEVLKKTLVETRPNWHGYGGDDTFGMHTGVFMGILKTCAEDDQAAPETTLRVSSGDRLTLSYEDRENTDPGVPTVRSSSIFAVRPSEPQLMLFDVRKTREVDRSPDAKARLERIRRRPGNENVNVVYRDVFEATPMKGSGAESTNPVPVNVAADVPMRVYDRSRARYAGSEVKVEATARSERLAAEAEGRDPEKVTLSLKLGAGLSPFRLTRGLESEKESAAAGSFGGVLRLALGDAEVEPETNSKVAPRLRVTGSDVIELAVLGEDGKPVLERSLQLVSDATLALTDSSFEAERAAAHVGESFFVVVDDADRDLTDEPDRVDASVKSLKTGVSRPLTLTETMPHSGVFTARLRPVMFAPDETVPNVATGGVASAHEVLTEDRFAVGYGDSVVFTYRDAVTLPGTEPRTLAVTGTVHRGSNGEVRLFSKRFADRDAAVLVQFRLAECLFEQAKEHRRLKQSDKASADIAEGRAILEEALRNNPDSAHVVQGEYLLANLYQELAAEAREAGDEAKASKLYQEALSRFSQILGTWAEGEYAARSQYHKALCLEMLKDYGRASEEYVKMTYLYPESELVGEATIRLATYYYVQERRYDIAGHIYRNFQQRFPRHDKAPRALFMAGSCYVKEAETIQAEIDRRKEAKEQPLPGGDGKVEGFYRDAEKTFDSLVDVYRDSAPAKLKAQALYWAGDVCVRRRDFVKAYRNLKRCVFEYPETEWARRARGLLLQQGKNFSGIDE